MNKKLIGIFTIAAIVLMTCASDSAFAADQTKILLGAGLITGGAALTASNVKFCLSDCRASNAAATTGLVMVGVGTFFLIKGLHAHSLRLEQKEASLPAKKQILVGGGPVKHGWGGGVVILW